MCSQPLFVDWQVDAVMINCMCNLAGQQEPRYPVNRCPESVWERVSGQHEHLRNDVNSNRQSEADCLPSVGGPQPIRWRPDLEKGLAGKNSLSAWESFHWSVSIYLGSDSSWNPGPSWGSCLLVSWLSCAVWSQFADWELGACRCPYLGFPGASDGKICLQSQRPGLTPGWVRFPGEANDYPLQYSCLENSMDRGAWWATVYGVAKSQARLSD